MKGKGAGVFISQVPLGEAAPSGFNSEHFQPKQPSKTLEKAPRKERKILAGRGQPGTYTGAVWLERYARHCSRCRGHGRKQNRGSPALTEHFFYRGDS